MIYFDIQHHGNASILNDLLERLKSSESLVRLSYDGDIKSSEFKMLELNHKNSFSDFSITKSPQLSWGGWSIVNNMLSSIETALTKSDWSYYVNLSGACLPLKKMPNLLAAINRQVNSPDSSFCFSFMPQRAILYVPESENRFSHQIMQYGRVKFEGPNRIINSIKRREIDPAKNIMHRLSLHFEEVGKDSFFVRALSKEEKNKRNKLMSQEGFRVGRQWLILSRRQAEWIVNSSFVSILRKELQSIFIPDEIFFQMALNSKQNPLRTSVIKSSLRFGEGGPYKVDMGHIKQAINEEKLIIRKVNQHVYKRLGEVEK
ncbi:beta-1,6-N-acetylglucosaminyltransferase [uncultured Paraglaciecola sp.]|uniref:beta-1,6-N-acetylglucosaminyltransferase n=1 Tax=uncultured Paraglaciecola sp. TaxID=1765024 RepID=UPI0025930C35|nr:beta-1,6-N-acetylglucosaminyltransferase [uncultured Paraglaciecola sp.]